MKTYLELVKKVLNQGAVKKDRTGTGTRSLFGEQLRIDLRKGFPLLTTKKVYFSSVLKELLWFIRGATNIHDGLGCGIWDAWADDSGELGPIYGYQWRSWPRYKKAGEGSNITLSYVDQLSELLAQLKQNPDSRRHIVSAWNVADLPDMALPPCHVFFQFYVVDGFLDCQLYQRSADLAVGVPFNIASYALLLMMVAQECGYQPRYFIHTFGDVHLYENHLEAMVEQLARKPGRLPKLTIENKPFFDLVYDDFTLLEYHPQPFIKLPVAV
ncbi:MAG: thymidylate synthase [bacterium]